MEIHGRITRSLIAIMATALMALSVGAAEIPTSSAEAVGLSSERLLRINSAMQRHIDAGVQRRPGHGGYRAAASRC